MSQESLFGFLTGTGLPVVSSLAAVIRWISLGLCAFSIAFAVFCFATWDAPLWNPHLPWSGALPSLTAAPLFFVAWAHWRANRLQRAATVLFLALFTLSILANWPRGVFSPAWYMHPFLSLLATVCLGVIPGLTLTLAAVVAMLCAAIFARGPTLADAAPVDVWVHVTSLAALTLASALAGAITNRVVYAALVAAEGQRRKNFESSRALRHRERLLRHAMRMETVGDLAGMVCHQLRNTFQVLLGHVVLANAADDQERVRRLGLIEQTLDQTKPLLDQLMWMAHPEEGTVVPTDLTALLRQFHDQAALVIPSTVRLSCELPDAALLVLVNPRGLVHTLWNLVINARQAISGEGAITLRCGSEGHQAWLEVSDSGSGIPREIQDRIFDPYFTTKPAGQGTGLGLAAVARFVRSNNGLIQVDSEVGRGTTFRMRFPLATAMQSA